MILFFAQKTDMPVINRDEIVRWIEVVARTYCKRIGDINYIFCDDNEILNLNQKFLGHEYYTDIITFDYTLHQKLSGDIYISLDTVKSNSEIFNTHFIEELYRVMIHGILHLCGIEDTTDRQRVKMRKAENSALLILSEMRDKK
ncbi:MAG TPA: rRNA maturation RNase YbeY [Bacteroidaceae bacterium]|nr:rRNA maturation RNase YbeY [Bacteroidaceae bacterium]